MDSIFKGFDKSKLVSATEDTVKDVFDATLTIKDTVTKQVELLESKMNLSITNFVKKMMVISRVFIQNKIFDDPSLNDNLTCIQHQYLSFILAALNLTDNIDNNRTVKTMMEVVSTERYRSFSDIVDTVFGLEANGQNNNTNTTQNKWPDGKSTQLSFDVKEKDLSLACGRIIEVELMNGKKINIPVQLIPTVIPNDVAEKFVTLNFTPDITKRWFQVTAGEISFFKDFLFQMDLIKQTEDAIRKDKTGILYEMKMRQRNAAREAAKDMAKNLESKNINNVGKQNLANSIFIFDKQSFMQTAKNAGLNWRNPLARDRFFNLTFSFMVVLIDPIYAKSEYYWSGIDAIGEFSNKQLKSAAKKESYDLKDIMAAFAQGHGPRF